ncbi:MAG: type II-B CRISPR-associated RNA-guided endonuclease Cas9/Csx12 [Leptonema sp. (in: bacteria)]
MKFISPLSIDLGAKETGVLLAHYKEDKEPISLKGVVVSLDPNQFTISLKDRLANRHRMRSEKRRKLAKRLFFLILESEYGLKEENTPIWKFIRGLLNRRGFTFLQEETNELSKEEIPLEFMQSFFPEDFKNCKSDVLDYIRKKANDDLESAKEFWKKLEQFNYNKKEKEFLKEYENVYTNDDFKNFTNTIQAFTKALIKEIEEGSKHRKVYLKEIKEDILNSKDLKNLLKTAKKKITPEEFFSLIGHISNIQLRCLRKYFNDIRMKTNDYWDPERLKKFYIRYLKSWHTKKDSIEREHQKNLLRQLIKENQSILELFLDNDPEISIPPYEDQNNRNIPKCQSLLLNAKKLDQEFLGWREIVKKILNSRPQKDFYDLENVEKVYRELVKSLQGANKEISKVPFDKDSIVLQRILETNKNLDPYHLRLLVEYKNFGENKKPEQYFGNTKNLKKFKTGKENLNLTSLTEKEKEMLIRIAERVYFETEEARKGLWEEETSLFSKCNSKTKRKSKTQDILVKQILGITNNKDFSLEDFLDKVWNLKISGSSTVKSLCKNIEETRKKYGNFFKEVYDNIVKTLRKKQSQAQPKEKEQKEIIKIIENVEKISDAIAQYLGHSEKEKKSYKNPFSLAQLYNVLEVDRNGFNKICYACILENSWRSEKIKLNDNLNEEFVAKGVRLSSDTGRPFDGQIDRIITRISKEVAIEKLKQIKSTTDPNEIESLEIPVFMENNQFSFTEEALDLKKSSKAKDKLSETKKKFEDRLSSKEERIKNDSKGICAYTGKIIGNDGEIDHIIPRSTTKKFLGTIYNSELNLLYVSKEGNQKKGNNEYTLEEIHPKFLNEHFKTEDLMKVKKEIKQNIQKVLEDCKKERRDYIIPDKLETKERISLKLALFDEDLREEIAPYLYTYTKALVNGTQIWFYKRLRKELKEKIRKEFPKLKNLHISSHFYTTSDDDFALKRLRDKLSKLNSIYTKEESQKETSHIIDASMVFAQGLIQSPIEGKYHLRSPMVPPNENSITGEWLESLLPQEIEMIIIKRRPKYRKKNPESSPLFKAGMYAERFLSLLVDSKGIRFGFTPTPKKSSKYLEKNFEKDIFESLKPFLLYQGKLISKDLDLEYYKKLKKSPDFVLLKLHRNQVKQYLQNCSKDDKVGLLLQSLRYITQNINVLINVSNKKREVYMPEKKEEFMKFKIIWNQKKIMDFELSMPYSDEWKKLHKFLKGVPEEDLEKKIEDFFHPPLSIKNPSKHGTKARKLSLPIKKEPSGGFRIARINENKEPVYQVQEGDGPYAGFRLENDYQVDFKTAILTPIYTRSKNVRHYYLEETIPESQISNKFVYFDEWRELRISEEQKKVGIQEIFMKPHTKVRAYLRVGLDLKTILQLFKIKENSSSTHALLYAFPLRIYKKDDANKEFSNFLKENLITKNYSYIIITKINPKMVYLEYVTDGYPKNLKDLYNQGIQIEQL